jgi:putative NADPH-quinone reductase
MQALLVIANPSAQSFSHAMANTAASVLAGRGCTVWSHDLYAEKFDPVEPAGESAARGGDDALLATHCRHLADADLVLVFHPNWWGQPPAIMKGWIDRVFRVGVAYDYPPGAGRDAKPVGLLRAKAALVFNTSNTPWDRELAVFGNPLEGLWKICVFGLCGVRNFDRCVFGPVAGSTDEQRAAWLAEVAEVVAKHA